MYEKYFYIAIALTCDGIAGLSGGLLPQRFVYRHISALLAFAAATLTAAAFVDMLPSATVGAASPQALFGWALAGFALFYFVENLLGHKHGTVGPMVLIGDALHNTTDGVAIASAFLLDLRVGIATSIAVFIHEIPQEIGDYAILISCGYSKGRALFYLFLVQLSAVLGAIATILAAQFAAQSTRTLVAISAGGFLYIAAASILPELRHQKTGTPLVRVLAFCAGLGVIGLLATFVK